MNKITKLFTGKNKIIKASIFLVIAISIFCISSPVLAADSGIIPNDRNQIQTGNYQLNDFVILMINVSKVILGLTGSAALLMFIYGGVMFLISAGSSEKVNKAKSIITGAVIGLVIVFASYTIIGFVVNAMGIQGAGWASSNWFSGK